VIIVDDVPRALRVVLLCPLLCRTILRGIH